MAKLRVQEDPRTNEGAVRATATERRVGIVSRSNGDECRARVAQGEPARPLQSQYGLQSASEEAACTMAHSPPHVEEPGATSRLRKLCASKDAQIEGLTSRVEVLSDDLHDLMRERDYLLSTCSQLEDCAHQCQEEAALLSERVVSLEADLKTAGELQGRASLPERRLREGAASGLEERVATLEAQLKSAAHRTEAAEAAQAHAEANLGAECARRLKADEAQRDVGTEAKAIEALEAQLKTAAHRTEAAEALAEALAAEAVQARAGAEHRRPTAEAGTAIEALAEAQAMDAVARQNTALQAEANPNPPSSLTTHHSPLNLHPNPHPHPHPHPHPNCRRRCLRCVRRRKSCATSS